jgi:stage IV sporulation protein FB
VLLGEPERTQADLNFALFGFPVRIHPFFWLVGVILGYPLIRNPADLLVWILAFTFSILVHELGHAVAMRLYGFHPWITLYGMGGLTSYNQGQVYGSRGGGPLAQILITLAGPVAGFLLAAVIVAVVKLSGHQVEFYFGGKSGIAIGMGLIGSAYLTEFLFQVLYISIVWGVVNLMPVYPLDGGQIAREILLVVNPRDGIRQSLVLSIITAAILAGIGLLLWHSLFVAILFGYLAFMSYTILRAYSGRGPGW